MTFVLEFTIIELTSKVNINVRGGCLRVEFKDKAIKKVCEDASVAEKKYGRLMAAKIQLRIDQIRAADSVEMMIQCKIGRCHSLQGKRKDQYAVDLVHPQRLIFEKNGSEIQIAYIIEIVDYH